MKYQKIRDLVTFLLMALGIATLIVLSAFLESSPLGISVWVATVVGTVLWIVWGILAYKEHKPIEPIEPILWVSNGKEWVATDGSGRTRPFNYIPRPRGRSILFDQDEDAIHHLDFDTSNKKEQA